MAASTKARTTVLLASRMVIGPSVASGSTASTALAKRRIASLSLGSSLGAIETRARPSGVIQSLTRSGGRATEVIGCACSDSAVRPRSARSGEMKACSALARSAGLAFASAESAAARRRAASGAGALLVARSNVNLARLRSVRRHFRRRSAAASAFFGSKAPVSFFAAFAIIGSFSAC